MNKGFFWAAGLGSLILCGCAPGEGDLGGYTLLTTDAATALSKSNSPEYKELGAYYTSVATTLYLSTVQSKSADGKATTVSVSVSMSTFPTQRRYLFLHKQPLFFSDASSLSTSAMGLLSATDVQSQQDVTSVLGEIAKTIAGAGVKNLNQPANKGSQKDCITGLPENWSYTLHVPGDWQQQMAQEEQNLGDLETQARKASRDLTVRAHDATNGDAAGLDYTIKVLQDNVQDKLAINDNTCDRTLSTWNGFCVYEPTPIQIMIECKDKSHDNRAQEIISPAVFNVYKYSHIEMPRRGFFTNPHDSYTMQDGVIVGHKYSSESYLKGFFDFLTTPVRAALPTTQTSTQVQTGGGKPEQTTNTTTYSVNPGN